MRYYQTWVLLCHECSGFSQVSHHIASNGTTQNFVHVFSSEWRGIDDRVHVIGQTDRPAPKPALNQFNDFASRASRYRNQNALFRSIALVRGTATVWKYTPHCSFHDSAAL